MDRRKFLTLSGSALAASAAGLLPRIAYAKPDPSTKATLNLFRVATDTDIRLTNEAVARFNQKYPGVTVNPQYVSSNPWGEYINQFMNSLGGSSAPDIVEMATEGISTLGSRKVMRDIQPLVDADPEGKALFDGIEPNLLNGLRYGDTLSFVPNEWNTVVNFYNTALLEKAGIPAPESDWDWDKFLEVAKALTVKDSGGNVTQYGYFVPGGQFALSPWFMSNSTGWLSADGHQSNVRDPRFRETLEYLHALIFDHRVAPTFALNDYGQGPFVAGQVAMFSGTHGRVPDMISAKLKTVGVQYFPRKLEKVAIMGVAGFGITNASKNPELAFELVKELTGAANSQQLANLMRSLPTQRGPGMSAEYTAFPENAKIFYESAAVGRALPFPPNFAEVEKIAMRNIEAYLTGNRKIDETIDNLDNELSRAMSRVKW
jgi:multiple sugar transport system substrate-binding protein